MLKKVQFGLRAIIVLGVIYAIEMAILGFVHRSLSDVPYRVIAPPVVAIIVLLAWVTAFVDMKKGGER